MSAAAPTTATSAPGQDLVLRGKFYSASANGIVQRCVARETSGQVTQDLDDYYDWILLWKSPAKVQPTEADIEVDEWELGPIESAFVNEVSWKVISQIIHSGHVDESSPCGMMDQTKFRDLKKKDERTVFALWANDSQDRVLLFAPQLLKAVTVNVARGRGATPMETEGGQR